MTSVIGGGAWGFVSSCATAVAASAGEALPFDVELVFDKLLRLRLQLRLQLRLLLLLL